MQTIDPKELVDRSVVEIKFLNTKHWTFPVLFTQDILDRIYKDYKIEKLKITTDEGILYELDVI